MSQQQPQQQRPQQQPQPHQQPLPPSQPQARPPQPQIQGFPPIQPQYAYQPGTHTNFQRPSFNQQFFHGVPYQHPITYGQFPPMYANPPQPHVPFNAPISAPSTGQQVTSTTKQRLNQRPKVVATIRHPDTKQEIDLKPSSSTKISTTATTNNSATNANKNPTVSNNSNEVSSTSPSFSNIFLQKVSEASNPEKANEKDNETSAEDKEAIKSKKEPKEAEEVEANTVEKETTAPEKETKPAEKEVKPVEREVKELEQVDKEVEKVADTTDKEVNEMNDEANEKGNEAKEEQKEAEEAKPIEVSEEENKSKNEDEGSNGDENDTSAKDDDNSEVKKEEGESDDGNALHYEPGQYNPISNRSGKRVYSKQFLLDVCEKICNLTVLDGPQKMDDQEDPFKPVYAQTPRVRQNNSTSGRQSQPSYMGRNSAGQEGRQRKVIPPSSSLTQEVELKTVANPWRPSKDVRDETPNEVTESEILKKKFRSILNKLTPNNFESLSASVTNLGIDTEAKLSDVIDIIFAKALTEPGYCVLYGQMCNHLKKTTSGPHFDERQKTIEEEQDPIVKKHLQDELYEDMYRCRMRGLGLIKFIGELYKIHMLNDTIMFECINRLIADISEESLECLCDLLTTIGEKLDESSQAAAKEDKKTQKAPKPNAYQGGQKSAAAVVASGAAQPKSRSELTTLDPVFDKLHKIRKNKELPITVRIRFKLLDVCELREKFNWQSKKTKDNNPKKIDEIRVAHQEKLDAERRQNAMGPRRSQEGRRGLGHSSGSSNQISSMANESGGIRNATNMHASSSSHSIRDYSIGDNTKSNSHNEQIEHQRSIKALINITSGHANKSSTKELRPLMRPTLSSSIGGPGGGLRPCSAPKTAAAVAPSTAVAGSRQVQGDREG